MKARENIRGRVDIMQIADKIHEYILSVRNGRAELKGIGIYERDDYEQRHARHEHV